MLKESDLEKICPSCLKAHDNGRLNGGWKPEFSRHEHYKTMACCGCGYKIFFKTEHFSSGHY